MQILHLNNEKSWRGGERQTLLLAMGLRDRGIRCVIGCRPRAWLEQRARAEGVGTLPIPGSPWGAVLGLVGAARGFDLIHCHTGRTHSLAALTVGWHRKPFVVTRRVDFVPGRGWFNRYKFGQVARVACISQFIADQLAAWGVPAEKLVVIRSAVMPPPPEWLTAQHRAACRGRLGIGPDCKLVGNIGALVGHKDHATLLRAAKAVVAQRPDVRFVIVGEGELRAALEQQRRQLGLERFVVMPGFIPQAEQLLPAFDVLAMSSCMEGLGSIVLDAFAAGVPVAATAGGGLPESVRHEETGLLVPVKDHIGLAGAILRLLEDGALAARLCTAARAWVRENCSTDQMVTAYLRLYEATLSLEPRRAQKP